MSQATKLPTSRTVAASDEAIATAQHEMEKIVQSMVGDKMRRAFIERTAYPRDNASIAHAITFVVELDETVAPNQGADVMDALLDYLAAHPDPAVRAGMTVEIR